MRRIGITVAILVALSTVLLLTSAFTQPQIGFAQGDVAMTATPMQSYAGKVRAPDFPVGLDWLNVPEPLSMTQLRGKAVLLDFWTYGCINCIHVIPDLKRLEAEFPNELVVIGVHSAKFANEGETENIRYILKRYGIEHPVVNDRNFIMWQIYGVRAWPTFMLIDPQGRVLGYYSGEGVYEALQPTIAGTIAEFSAKGMIDRTPLRLAPELERRAPSILAFPSKVLADSRGGRLFIADTNHNRVIVADLESYAVQAVIGSGVAAFRDGTFAQAAFNWVHGMSLSADGETLYIADTGNHAVRAADLRNGTVVTVAGTGRQNRDWRNRLRGGAALETALNSPWDVHYQDGVVYIAMAGPHQLWALDLASGIVAPFVGSGREGIVDGALLESELAQPSGIVGAEGVLYFTDAESSAVRKVDLRAGRVQTIVGTGLFDFGDVDGVGDAVRLQHALGLTLGADGKLYVADTYNHKIKVIDPATRESRTLVGGAPGFRDGDMPQFWEPGGISYADGRLYVADTNNDAIRVIDLATLTVSTVVFPNPEQLAPTAPVESADEAPPEDFFGTLVRLPDQTVAPGASQIVLNIQLPEGYKQNDQAPFTLRFYNNTPIARVAPASNNLSIIAPPMPVRVPVLLSEGEALITLDAAIFYCEAVNETLCFPAFLRFELPLRVASGGATEIAINYLLVPPQLN
ncbi:MAG: thioredoxin-like domain-containing protein [Aggregatilineales bacterium]